MKVLEGVASFDA